MTKSQYAAWIIFWVAVVGLVIFLICGCAGSGTYYGDLDEPISEPAPYVYQPLPVPYTVNVGPMGEPYHQVTVWPY